MPKLSRTVAEPTALKTPTLSMKAWKPRLLELTDNLALQSFNEGHFLCEKKKIQLSKIKASESSR